MVGVFAAYTNCVVVKQLAFECTPRRKPTITHGAPIVDVGGQQVTIERVFRVESQVAYVAPEVAAILKITHHIWSLLRTSPDFGHPIRKAITRFFTTRNSPGGLLDDILGLPQLGDMFSDLSCELS